MHTLTHVIMHYIIDIYDFHYIVRARFVTRSLIGCGLACPDTVAGPRPRSCNANTCNTQFLISIQIMHILHACALACACICLRMVIFS